VKEDGGHQRMFHCKLHGAWHFNLITTRIQLNDQPQTSLLSVFLVAAFRTMCPAHHNYTYMTM